MTGEERELLIAFLTDQSVIEVTDTYDNEEDADRAREAAFDAWYSLRFQSQETEDVYKLMLASAHVWEDRYEAGHTVGRKDGYTTGHEDGYAAGHEDGYERGVLQAIEDLERQSSLATGAPVTHLQDCQGPGCGASCTCWCHLGEGRG